MRRLPFLAIVATGLLTALASGCGGGSGSNDWYYHWSCNGDPACLGDNPTGQATGTAGPLPGGQISCNELMTQGNKFWNIPPATQSCDNSSTTPPPKLVSLAVTPQGPSIVVGATQQFTATASYSDGSTKDVTGSATWSSSASNVASVSSSGLATGVAVGSTAIRASFGGASASSPLAVTVSFSVLGFSPGGGAPGTAITIAGANFPTGPGAVTVKLCGNTVGLVSASATQLVVDAPTPTAGANTAVSTTVACTVSVTTSQGTVTAPAPFQVLLNDVPAVYFLSAVQGSVMAVAKSGGTVHTLATGLHSPAAIAATPWAVYWMEVSSSAGELKMVGTGGGPVTSLAPCNYPNALGLAVDGAGDAFIGTSGGLAVVQPGGAATLLAPAAHPSGYTIALEGATIYWTEQQLGGDSAAIRDMATSGGAVTTLVSWTVMPTGIAADGTSVYWVNPGSAGVNGVVQKVPLTGGAPVTLANTVALGSLSGVGLDASYYYWAQAGHIFKVPLGGGTAINVVSDSGYPPTIGGMVLDATTNLYWTDSVGLKTMAKGGGTITTLVSGVVGAVAVTN